MKKLKYLLILIFVVSFIYSPSFSYAKFHAVKYLEGTITVPENNYCLGKNINTLSDCILVMDGYTNSASAAKTAIKAKGTPDFSKIAPQISYRESGFSIDTTDHSTDSSFLVADSYTFNASTGTFSLVNPYSTIIDSNETSYMDKYSCFDGTTTTNCSSIYQIFSEQYQNNTYTVSNTMKETGVIYEVFDSDNGLYYANDDLGESYYYRGSVKNNFVQFAGKYWRIVRRNGDGSVRLLYYGPTSTESARYSVSNFNNSYWDPTFHGFMYNDVDFSIDPITSNTAVFYNFHNDSTYYFSKKYTDNGSNFTLVDDSESDFRSGQLKDMHDEIKPFTDDSGNTHYYYTCLSTYASTSCPVLFRFMSYNNASSIFVQMISHSSTSYENAIKNVKNSTILDALYSFWDSEILNQQDGNSDLYSDYIANAIYCNDRSISSTGSGNGFSLFPNTIYSGHARLFNNSVLFTCPNLSNDGFTALNSSFGNAKLINPIGLITSDEAVAAGLSNSFDNPLSYLVYSSDIPFWTMTPSYFASTYRHADMWRITTAGRLNSVGPQTLGTGVRPVISLKSTVKITGGDGTASNPYQLSLQ